MTWHELTLHGVRSTPLADYLKGMGLLRALAEQVHAECRALWRDGTFVVHAPLDAQELVAFLLESWAPTPFVAPWNGGSGFFPKDTRTGIDALAASELSRFAPYRSAILKAREVLQSLGVHDKDAVAPRKREVIATLRASLDDDALRWIDAAVVLGDGDPRYAPLLGTGGNDGRSEFSNNQMQRLAELLLDHDEAARSRAQLDASLFGGATELQAKKVIGQFAPASSGGPNTGFGFDRVSLINPWDYVLAMEGAALFAASASRALDASRGASFPFFVRDVTPAGFGSASEDEDTRGELWLPLWSRFTSLGELASLVAEGRIWVGSRQAASGLDIGRAVRAFGVARGITAFERFVIAQRNGLAFFASPVGRVAVADEAANDPLATLDGWLERLRRSAGTDRSSVPMSVRQGMRAVEEAVMLAGIGADFESRLLLALGALSSALVVSRHHSTLQYVPPMPSTPRGTWTRLAAGIDSAWRLALLAGAAGLRSELQPVSRGEWPKWSEHLRREAEVGAAVPFTRRLARAAARRARAAAPDQSGTRSEGLQVQRLRGGVTLTDLSVYLRGDLDERLLGAALEGGLLTQELPPESLSDQQPALPLGALTCLAALIGPPEAATAWTAPAALVEALAAGHGERSVEVARRLLQAREMPTPLAPAALGADLARRIAAISMLPFAPSTCSAIWRAVAPADRSFPTPSEVPA